MMTRRQFGLGFGAAFAAGATIRPSGAAQPQAVVRADELARRFTEIEGRCGGWLGVGIIDTRSGRVFGHRGDERFPMCSTHKALTAAALLARADRGEERLDLAYEEDSQASVDMNVVMTDTGRFIELQGTAEKTPFDRDRLNRLLDLAQIGVRQMFSKQREALADLL